jgi:hypothetical protein
MLTRITLLLLSIVLCNCDVPGFIVLKNRSNAKAIYRYEVIKEPDSVKTYTIEIGNGREQNETSMVFGFGYFWTDKRIKEYLSTINKIEIISSTKTVILVDKDEMFKFFKSRRKGLFKNIVKIKID